MPEIANPAETAVKESVGFTRSNLIDRYKSVRSFTEALTEPLETEDFVIQAAEHTSPAKWHLAHTSWFFETFLLKKAYSGYQSLHPQYSYLFNSYYLQTGVPHCRARRGNLSRPTVKEVFKYRKYVDEHVLNLLDKNSKEELEQRASIVEIGLNHEQQHQELLLADLKFMFAQNPLNPVYVETHRPRVNSVSELNWTSFDEGVYKIGHVGKGFGYDNEFPLHKTYIHDFELANRPVTNGEYIAFIEDGGYEEPKWWLDEGYATVKEKRWEAPLYWAQKDNEWHQFTLSGLEKVDLNEPVCHVSYFEADAYARWADCRLPTEQEWEVAAGGLPVKGNFVEDGYNHPIALETAGEELQQMFGNVWEWTCSSYAPYPGYKPLPGALGEYNGKFMCNQYVLRGGSCATPETHIRKAYRNFFHPCERWQFMGIRLAR